MGCDDHYEQEPQPQVNEELFRRVMKRIERDQNWDQQYWGAVTVELADKLEVSPVQAFAGRHWLELKDSQVELCRTKFCVAGHTVLEAGDTMLVDMEDLEGSWCLTVEGNLETVEQRATKLLGLDNDQAAELFAPNAGNNGLEAYKEFVTEVTGVTFE